MGTGDMRGLLGYYIAWSWQLQKGTEELGKINTAGCMSSQESVCLCELMQRGLPPFLSPW